MHVRTFLKSRTDGIRRALFLSGNAANGTAGLALNQASANPSSETREVKIKVANVSGLGDAIGVIAHVRNGEVLLSGFVDSDDVRKDIVAAANTVSGASKVHDRITLKR